MRLSALGIRHQLWALFGLFLFTGATVLAIDEIAQHQARQSLLQIKDDSLQRLRRIKAVSDAYGLEIVDTAFRTRNDLITWPQGVAALDLARAHVEENWRALRTLPRGPEQAALFDEIARARGRADRAAARLRAILVAEDIDALGRFADTELYPAIDPVTERFQKLSDLAMVEAEQIVRADIEHGRRISTLRIGLSLASLLLAALIGRRILRNAYRGVESLTDLAQRMRQHDYAAEPRYRPRGELGEVMAAFLDMRGDVLASQTRLTEQLEGNERVRAALERREAFQRALLDAAQVAIMVVDVHGVFALINPFAERMLGWPSRALLGQEPLHALIDGDALQALAREIDGNGDVVAAADWTALRTLAERGEPPREMVLRHRDGRALPALVAVSAMHDDEGQPHGLLVVAADLSATKRLERALRESEARANEANRAKSAFLATMSHEIRTPMIGVTGMVEVLSHTALDPEQRRALNVIESSSQALLQIIGDILDFSKIEAGRLELAPAATSLPRMLRGTVANFSGSASSKGLTLTCHVDERVAPAHYADALRLRQILGNFLSNAIKFTAQGAVQASLELLRADDGGTPGRDLLCFRVTDTGIGVSADAQARLFQPFAQAEGDTTRRFGGTGLGLAISRRLAELMGGAITMESVPGVGTTMRLTVALPRAPRDELVDDAAQGRGRGEFATRQLPGVAEAERERSLVLVVDDHPTNRLVIARQLALAGYASEAVEDGEQGLERWRSGRYALLLSDVHMPRLDGYGLARRIRAEEAQAGAARTPIVALTASALKGETERCLDAGMDDCLTKPVSIPVLVATLQRWLPHTAPVVAAPDTEVAESLPARLPQLEQPPALDPATLDLLTGGDAAQARAVLDDFLASVREDVAAFDAACGAGDFEAMIRQAHKLKGASAIVGAVELRDCAARLETAGREAAWPRVLPLAADLATAVERLHLFVAERYPAGNVP